MSNRVTLRHGNSLDYLTPEDGVRNCRQAFELNSSSTLELDIHPDSGKFWYFEKPDMLAEAGGRVYCLIGDDSLETGRDDLGKPDCHVTLKELWYKLGKRYVTAYNCTVGGKNDEFDHIDKHMVVLLGNSGNPLYVNGARVTNPYPLGSAQYHMWVLLHGSGWTLDTRFANYWPTESFDLETDKESVLANIELLQGLYGGMLLWDSQNKRVALVDENRYKPDNGFAIRYAQNLKGITRSVSRDIVTRLYPYGNGDLNIAKVNGNREYLEDFNYTSEVLEGIAKHSDIYNQNSLKAWGARELKKLARPRNTYTVNYLDYTVEGMELHGMGLAGAEAAAMATVHDAEVVGGSVVQRVMGVDRNVFNPVDCSVTIGDVTGNWPTTIKDLVTAEETVTNTITKINKIGGVVIRGTTPALDKAVIQMGQDLQTTANGIYSHVQRTYETKTDAAHTYGVLSTTISQTAEEIRTEAKHTYETKTAASTTKAELKTTISQTAEAIKLEAKATYETKTKVAEVKKNLESSITVTAREIRTDVKATYETKTSAGTTKRELQSSISQTASAIRTEVTNITNGLSSRITQTASRVSVVVDAGNNVNASIIVRAINNSSSVRIDGDKININGSTTFTNLKNGLSNGSTTIDGGCIKTGTIHADRIRGIFTDSFTVRCGNLYIAGNKLRLQGGYVRY